MPVTRVILKNYSPMCIARRHASELLKILSDKIVTEREKVMKFRQSHGSKVVGQITVDQIYGGMRGMLSMICETSELDPNLGIRFRGLSVSECQKALPKAKGGSQPLPEGMFWLLLTGDVPTEEQVSALSAELSERASLPTFLGTMIKQLPSNMHPMTQFTSAINTLNIESVFDKNYRAGIQKTDYWKYVFEDALNLVAQVPVVAAKVYINAFKDGKGNTVIDQQLDWGGNLAQMLGIENPLFKEFLRLYLTCHSDHESGNVSAHTVHLVGSALSDPYLAFAAGMNGLAGPIHGQANVQVLRFYKKLVEDLGTAPTDDSLKTYCENLLKQGLVVPGFGHAVLRIADPRYDAQREFAQQHFPNDPMFKISQQIFQIVPPILKATGKVQNPWPNVDGNSGICFQATGLENETFYIVLFGVSRALGTMASLIWARALGLPIERPKSISSSHLMEIAARS